MGSISSSSLSEKENYHQSLLNQHFKLVKVKAEQKQEDAIPNKDQDLAYLQILSFNILADLYATPQYFPYCNQECIPFKYRCFLVERLIKHLESDILCLQEVDNFEHYEKVFQQIGYQCVIFRRNTRNEGGMICYKFDRFTLLQEQFVCFDEAIPDLFGKNKFDYWRNNKLGIVRLEDKVSQKKLIICNTHIFWDPKTQNIKFLQACLLLSQINELYLKYPDCPIFFCGDFNSMPSSNQSQPSKEAGENKFQCYYNQTEFLQIWDHFNSQFGDIEVQSAYSDYNNSGEHPQFTTYTVQFSGNIDYIFYLQSNKAELVEILQIPDEKWVKSESALPNSFLPSDHLPLMAKFKLI